MEDNLLLNRSASERFFKDSAVGQFLHAAAYSGIEAPVDGVLQLGAHAMGKDGVKLNLIEAPEQAQFNSGAWYAQTAGSAVGMVLPFLAARGIAKGAGHGLMAAGERNALTRATTLNLASSQGFRLATPYLEAAATGFVAEGLFRPVDPAKGDVLTQRLQNAGVGAATFTTLVAGNRLLKGLDASYVSASRPWAVNTFAHDAVRHGLSGTGAGLLNAELHALASEGRHATGQELFQSAYTFGVMGVGFRTAGEAVGRYNGTKTISDLVSADKEAQAHLRGSEQAKSLLLDYGDARAAKPAEANSLSRASSLVSDLAAAEARANVAAGKAWSDVMQEQIRKDPARQKEIESIFSEMNGKGQLDANWQQTRFALVRERAFINDLLNKNGETPALKNLVESWNQRWASKVDTPSELVARTSRTFNANDKDEAGKQQYQDQMKLTADKKTEVVDSKLDPEKHQLVFDIGSAEGNVPNNLAISSKGRITAFAVELDPGSYLSMLNARRASMASGDGSFRALPVFENGVSIKLPSRSVDAFSSLSNIHELISYPREFYGPFQPENAVLAVRNWAHSLRDGGRIVVKDFLKPEESGKVLLVPKEVGTSSNPSMTSIEGKPIAPEYLKGAAGERFIKEFLGLEKWRGTDGEPQTIQFRGKKLNVQIVEQKDGTIGILTDARTAAELMASARYGMLEQRTQMIGATEEQFMNFTRAGWEQMFRKASPFGSRLTLMNGTVDTRAGSDYVQHRQRFFNLQDPAGRPIDLSGANPNWHTTYQGAFQKVPGAGSRILSALGMPNAVPVRPLVSGEFPSLPNTPSLLPVKPFAPAKAEDDQSKSLRKGTPQ